MAEEKRKDKRQKLGEILIQHGIINQNQLKEAMKVQSQSGNRLGSVLIDLKYSNIDEILAFLGKQIGVPTANLYKLTIKPAALSALPFEKMKEHHVFPLSINEKELILGMDNPKDFNAINDLQFLIGRSIHPVLILSFQIDAALKIIEEKGGTVDAPLRGEDLEVSKIQERVEIGTAELKDLFGMLVNEEASDLLLSAGVPPCIKKDNEVKRLPFTLLSPQQMKAYAYELMRPEQREEFERSKELDLAFTFPDIGRFRIASICRGTQFR